MSKAVRQKTTLSIQPSIYQQIKRIAARDRRDVSTTLEMALEAYIATRKQARRRPLETQRAEVPA